MALATRCPKCNALFRVAADQLKLRGGLVRCGECQSVFDGLATLSYVDDSVVSASAASPAAVGAVIAAIRKAETVAAPALTPPGEDLVPAAAPPETVAEAANRPPAIGLEAANAVAAPATAVSTASQGVPAAEAAAPEATPVATTAEVANATGILGDALAERAATAEFPAAQAVGAAEQAPAVPVVTGADAEGTLPTAASDSGAAADAAASGTSEATAAARLQDPAGTKGGGPAVDAATAGTSEAPNSAFVPEQAGSQNGDAAPDAATSSAAEAPTAAFLQERTGSKSRLPRPLLLVGAALLALLLLAQLAVAFRAEILVRFPQARPALGQLCKVFRCTVDWPARRDLLAVVGTELQSRPGTDAYELTAVVRNRGQITVALPAIELTLSDTLNRVVARKVFTPAEYLGRDDDAQAQQVAGLEPGADLTIRIAFEARELNAAGFVVYPFYL